MNRRKNENSEAKLEKSSPLAITIDGPSSSGLQRGTARAPCLYIDWYSRGPPARPRRPPRSAYKCAKAARALLLRRKSRLAKKRGGGISTGEPDRRRVPRQTPAMRSALAAMYLVCVMLCSGGAARWLLSFSRSDISNGLRLPFGVFYCCAGTACVAIIFALDYTYMNKLGAKSDHLGDENKAASFLNLEFVWFPLERIWWKISFSAFQQF